MWFLIYQVVKYWPEKGKSGFIVWRYELRRDDPEHAPWTKEGKKRIKELGLTLQVKTRNITQRSWGRGKIA